MRREAAEGNPSLMKTSTEAEWRYSLMAEHLANMCKALKEENVQ
jgi:hypothetical protein